ncbi:hypothetical protein EsH8_III_000363 [Colletotrichum jinshuiense]
MAFRAPLRPAALAARVLDTTPKRPSLSSRLSGRRCLPASFASVHTTSPVTQEAVALRQDPEVFVPLPEVPSSSANPSLADLHHSLRSIINSTKLLSDNVMRSTNRLLYPVPYKIPPRQTDRLHVFDSISKKYRILDAAWIRDRCPCPHCVSPSSGNKSFSTAEIPHDIKLSRLEQLSDGSVQIHWENDIPRAAAASHVSVFPANGKQSLKAISRESSVMFAGHPKDPSYLNQKTFWDKSTLEPRLMSIDYADFIAGGPAFRKGALGLSRLGLLFLTNVPQTETAVADIALKFGAVKETFYGRTWDVISKPDAENVAYTSAYLGLHSDMLYLDSPPKIQLLHCLENSCSGGESIFSDAHHAISLLRDRQPEYYNHLCGFQVPYHYTKNGFFYRQTRPVISHAEDPNLREVWWSPPFQAPFPRQTSSGQRKVWRSWLTAARAFKRILEDECNVFQYKLRPGECVLFDNRRVLHGRRAFDTASGRRWLKGTYVADEDFQSTLRGLRDDRRPNASG